jgi:hypothetical protein
MTDRKNKLPFHELLAALDCVRRGEIVGLERGRIALRAVLPYEPGF